MEQSSPDNPLFPLVKGWLATLRAARKDKEEKFGKDAEEAMQFFSGPHNFMWESKYMKEKINRGGSDDEEIMPPTMRISLNKMAEIVQLFGPSLYNRNPVRTVLARQMEPMPPQLLGDPMDPFVQQQFQMVAMQQAQEYELSKSRAGLINSLLNYTPNELDLKRNCRKAIDEALIKGAGILWTETYQPDHLDTKVVGSFYRTIDGLLKDPDAEDEDDIQWVAYERVRPVWEVERDFGWEPGSLKGSLESRLSQGMTEANTMDADDRARGKSNDLIKYYEIYSKMGMGDRLVDVKKFEEFDTEEFGDYCYLCVSEDCSQPLNLPPDLLDSGDAEAMFNALQWPIPFWIDGGWPYTEIAFHWIPGSVWPMSHLKPALGELHFLNWAMSFLASRIRTSSRDFIGVVKAAGEEVKSAILSGKDFTLIEIESDLGTKLTDLVSFLEHPQVNGDVWQVISAVADSFDKRVGLSELMYGMASSQSRSAADVNVRASSSAVRPDDMSQQTEDAMTDVARKEAFAWRWMGEAQDVAPILGQMGAFAWEQLVMSQDPVQFARELDCRIESGSMRKPNKNLRVDQMNGFLQTPIAQSIMQYSAGTGNMEPINAIITEWCKANDLDPQPFLLPPPPPPPQPMPPEGAPPPEAQGPPQ
jgi:hypothetical protein